MFRVQGLKQQWEIGHKSSSGLLSWLLTENDGSAVSGFGLHVLLRFRVRDSDFPARK